MNKEKFKLYFFKSELLDKLLELDWEIYDIINKYNSIKDKNEKWKYILEVYRKNQEWEKTDELKNIFISFIINNLWEIKFLYNLA